MRFRSLVASGVALLAVAALGAQAAGETRARDDSKAPSPADWPLVGRTPDNHHFSPLRQINDGNVQKLGLAWYADMPTRAGLVGTPLVVDGVIYQSAQLSMVYANDLRTGRLLWSFDPKVQFSGEIIPSLGARINRGVAVWKDKVYVGTGDCRLIAIDRRSGQQAWQADVCMGDAKFSITGAPRVGDGKVFIGPANMDDGSRRGFIDAYDAETGKRLWRFYTVPGDPAKGFENKAMAMASKTWGKDYWKRAGSASVIEGITYDPVTNLVYFGTSSASPDAPPDRGEGRNGELFAASVVAVNADTGEYVWHYQETPNNGWNYDSYQPISIAQLKIGGKDRRVLMHAPKNGYFYVLDAATGKLLAADQYGVRVNWSSHVDMKTGKPVVLPEAEYWKTGHFRLFPSAYGAHNWMPMAFSEATGLVYIPAIDIASSFSYKPASERKEGEMALAAASAKDNYASAIADGRSMLVAWDPVLRKVRWKVDEPLPVGGGTLATAGNLVFYGKGDGQLRAFAADTGKALWSVDTQGAVRAAPVTVEVDGEQLLLVASGSDASSGGGIAMGDVNTTERTRHAPSRLLAYKLGGSLALPAFDPSNVFPQPPLPRVASDIAAKGRDTLLGYGCDFCHGGQDLQAPNGSAPDLRKANAATHAALDKIVVGGAYTIRGMPRFADMPEQDLRLIQAYMLDRAWAAYDAQQEARAKATSKQ
jgi:quinohemoprotein ethanol dehydrogenase